MMKICNLFKRKIYKGDVVDLKQMYTSGGEYLDLDCVHYNIYNHNSCKVGFIELRFYVEDDEYYYGNVGYYIIDKYRGHNYAYHACLKLFEIAKHEFNMEGLIITCSPDNIASFKTINSFNGKLIETVDVPINHELYFRGEKIKQIYYIDLKEY